MTIKMRTGTITKIHEPKRSKNGGVFIRVEFQMEDKSWNKTDLCSQYRNFNRWKPFLKVGAIITNLSITKDKEIDADSFPKLYNFKVAGEWEENEKGEMRFVHLKPLPDIKPVEDDNTLPEQLNLLKSKHNDEK